MSWEPDVLGAGFEAQTLPLLDDEQGEVVATLVRHRPADDPGALPGTPATPSFALLYLHGWNDYFHQRELARELAASGAAFYGLDLRKYGRSLREHQLPGYVDSLNTYDEDIHVAPRRDPPNRASGRTWSSSATRPGGLTAALWAHRHPGALRAVPNAPWLELQGLPAPPLGRPPAGGHPSPAGSRRRCSPWGTPASLPACSTGGTRRRTGPVRRVPEGDPFYDGWGTNDVWRTSPSMPVRPGWLSAVLAGHAQVAEGLTITCPVLVLTSTRTVISTRWSS